VVAVATRLPVGLERRGGWGDTLLDLPPGRWFDRMAARPVTGTRVADLFATYPVALLTREDS